MEDHTENLEFNAQHHGSGNRPSFLLVICILSWISVGWHVLGAVGQLTKSVDGMEEEAKQAIYDVKQTIQETGEAEWMLEHTKDFLYAGIEHNTVHNYSYLFLFLLQGVAVYLMFQQKKLGFWAYLGIQATVLGVMIMYYPWPNFISAASVGYRAFTSVLFTILFAVNLKHMYK
ncbi:hypothetical protein [Parvicella tangerina]|uniref:Uncharacterized protein n=1 Tax=Parvicella tangerina TaxID=2829795 RepID=A0A916JQF4_9FLAO|nr:hypothetical protein [Parvicella tangerina]CAG5087181.1 hypothetical protein CRYO30217_03408 [Parvicella tangerina]